MDPTPVGEMLIAQRPPTCSTGWTRTLAGRYRCGRAPGARDAPGSARSPAWRAWPSWSRPSSTLKKTATGADIHVDVAPSDALVEGLFRGEYDFVLSRIPPSYDKRQLEVRPGRHEDICFMTRAGHPLAQSPTAPLKQLAAYEWVVQAPQTPLRQAVESVFVSAGVDLPVDIVNTTSMLVMISYLASSDALAPTPRPVADLFVANNLGGGLAIVSPPEQILVSPYYLVSRKNVIISAVATRLRELVFSAMNTPAA
jgi:DNA-binding transcriptional LysR family regulator